MPVESRGREAREAAVTRTAVRCAIYTRKSTEEGLEQSFNTLDAQREAAEAFIASQRHEGWTALPQKYDDGSYTGANMDRPALKRLLADIEAGTVNCVVVYKVDRLTRSLLDFARIMEVLDLRGATFVSVTQQFNTTASLGRLTLNILLSFAQFEREMISERTRDKMRAARRKGKFVGGNLILGYDVASQGGVLVVNEAEARRVREIFQLYLDYGALIPVVQELDRRGWTLKAWTTREGERARFVACDACGDWHAEEVIWQPSVRDASGMRAYIPCPAEGRVHVPDERLRQWTVDIGALARQLAAAMELAGTVENVLVEHLWKLGRRRLAGRFRDVFFAVARSRDDGGIPEAATRHLNATHGVLLALGNLRRMEGWCLPHFTVLDVKAITALTRGGLEVALDYIEDALPRERGPEKLTGIRSVALPEGTAWEDLTIEVVETSLLVSAGGYEKEMSLEEAGFADGRQGDSASDRPLQFLRLFATRRGCIALAELPGGERGKSRVQKQISVLRSRLRSLFAIGEEPIIFDKASGEYRCAFEVRTRADDGFPTPAGASWLDFRFEELAGGRLTVGVKSKEVFRARQIQRDDGRAITEIAEREDRTWREYSLVALGLAKDSGNPTPEGRALLECLRSEGKLQRPPEDMAVLKLGRWLRHWAGIEDDPINFSDSKKAWMAHFECGVAGMK